MQFLNDDMDEVYRRAAEEYPLKTDSADWNAVVKKMLAREHGGTPVKKSRKHHKWILLLVFMVPGLWLGNDYLKKDRGQYSSLNKEQPSNTNPVINDQPLPENTAPIDDIISLPRNLSFAKKEIPARTVVTVQKPSEQSGQIDDNIATQRNEIIDLPPQPRKNERVVQEKNTARNENGNSNDVNTKYAAENIQDKIVPSPANSKKIKPKKENRFYIGITAGPDVSTVKLQSVKKIGFTKAVVLGYQVNKKISVETGIGWDTKYYHSDGKYFSVKNITLPAYARIRKLDGECKMLEIPVAMRYNISRYVKSNVSVSAGISSYIMKKENYTYTVERNNSVYPRKASYKNSSTDLFAVATAGMSYQHGLAKNVSVRVEPNIRIPLKGVGIGSLPITSAGISIGIIKKFSK